MNILIWKFTNKHQETDPYLLLAGIIAEDQSCSKQTESQLQYVEELCQCIIHYGGFLTEKQTQLDTAGYFGKKGRAPPAWSGGE